MNLQSQWLTKSPPFYLGHRGFPQRARENTLASFSAALDAGAAGVELDVVVTMDGVPCVHHDPTAWTGNAEFLIADLPWAVIEQTDFAFRGGVYRIPGLTAVLDALGSGPLVNVEIKTPRAEHLETTVECTVPVLAGRANVLVSSFDLDILGNVHRCDPGIPLGYLFSKKREALEKTPPLHALHPRRDCVDREFVHAAHARDCRVHTWTVDDPGEAQKLLAMGVDAVITNRPDRMKAVF